MSRLKELGVDVKPKGLGMIYQFDGGNSYRLIYGESTCEDDMGAFDLQDIIELLPYTFDNFYLKIYRGINMYYFIYESINSEDDIIEKGNTPLLAAYNMLIWVAENGYLTSK